MDSDRDGTRPPLATVPFRARRNFHSRPQFPLDATPSDSSFRLLLHAAADEVVWPRPQPPTGTPPQQFPVAQAEDTLVNHICMARSQQTDMILDGDSITDYWQSTGRPVFDKHFAPRHAIDFGISGNGTQSILWRVEHGQLDTLHPKLAMILIGVNNSGSPVEQVAAGITKAVEAYRAKLPDTHILLLGIFPHGKLATDPMREITRKTNALIAKLDDGAHVTFLDIGDKFLQPDGSIAEDVMPDALHPGPKGYEIWADAVEPVVEKYCPMPAPNTPAPTITAQSQAEIAASLPPLRWPYPLDPPPGTFSTVFPSYYLNWFRNFQNNLDHLKQGPYDLIFDGDAQIGDFPGRGHDVYQARYAKLKLLDIALSGDHVQNVLWRVQHGSLDGQNPKLIVLLTGASNFEEDVKDLTGGVKLLLNEYKNRCPGAHILLLGIFPRGEDQGSKTWLAQINSAYANLADDRVTFLNPGEKFVTPEGKSTDNFLLNGFFDLSEKGYATGPTTMQPFIDKYIPSTAAKKP